MVTWVKEKASFAFSLSCLGQVEARSDSCFKEICDPGSFAPSSVANLLNMGCMPDVFALL